jgi:hypothetical protein
MARPPIARRAPYTAGEPAGATRVLDVLPHEFADFIAMERGLAALELGFPVVDDEAPGDIAGTLMEMSALVAHVLSLHQDRYGNEAFLGTAQSASSLVKHGRRLAYEPAPGLSAAGYIALFAKAGLSGTIAERFAFSSAAVGEKPAQTYELSEPALVDAYTNLLLPKAVLESIVGGTPSTLTLSELAVAAEDLDVAVGDVIAITWQIGTNVVARARWVTSVAAGDLPGETRVGLSSGVQVPSAADVSLVAKPGLDVHAFAHDAPAILDQVNEFAAPAGVEATDVFLEREIEVALAGQPIVRVADQTLQALRLVVDSSGPKQAGCHVELRHETAQSSPPIPNGQSGTVTYKLTPVVVFARTVTRITLQDAVTGSAFNRPSIVDRNGRYLSDWQVKAAVRTSRASEVPISNPLELAGEHPTLLPGRLLALEAMGEDAGVVPTQIARVVSASAAGGVTKLLFELVPPTQALGAFRLGYLRVLGNIGRLTHGKSVSEVLGDSDGVSPFQRLSLAKSPVAHSAGRDGAEPQLELRVGGVLFRRVVDFEDSASADAVYLTERSAEGTIGVVFGDGKHGAVPPSGKRHVQAVYRQGIGELGNTGAHTVSKIGKAHPILESAYNPVPMTGGVEPASPEEVRVEAPLYLVTFDRAVSVEDHAKLALRVPGVARARAFLREMAGVEGVMVVVANRTGAASNLEAVSAFLRARRDNTLPLAVVGPNIVDVTLTIGILFDPAFDQEQVKLELRALLTSGSANAPGLLAFGARDLGQPLFASQIVEWIERLSGIWAFRLLTFAVTSGATNPPGVPPAVLDTVHAEAAEWIRLLPTNLEIQTLSELA